MNRLKQLREAHKLSQVQLAMELNTTQASISKYELGKSYPDIGILMEIAKYFHVSMDYLLELSPFATTEPSVSLTTEECQILSLYNSLSSEKRKMAVAYLTGLRVQ